MSTPYISAADLSIFMGGATLSAPLAGLAVAAGMQSVRKYVDQEITLVRNDVVQLDGTGSPYLRLPQRPVLSVSQIVVGVGSEGIVVPTTDFFRRRSLLVRYRPFVWEAGLGNIFVTYDHGWCVESTSDSDFSESSWDVSLGGGCETVPPDIILATLNASRRAYNIGGTIAEVGAIIGETIGNYSYTASDVQKINAAAGDFLLTEKTVLARYRIKRVV